jgi:SulP family sulfate permease
VAAVTAAATLLLAPRVERGILVGVGLALAVHLWRELKVGVPFELDGECLNLSPTGVLYFGSAPAMERTLDELIASHPEVRRVVIHLGGLGRVDVTGALALRDVVEDAHSSGLEVVLQGASDSVAGVLDRVLSDSIPSRDDDAAQTESVPRRQMRR